MTRSILMLLMLAALGGEALAATKNTFVVTGRFEYEDKAWDYGGWTGEDPWLPVRHADVVIRDASRDRTLGRGATDEQGEFSIVCTTRRPVVSVQARIDAQNRVRSKEVKGLSRLRVVAPGGELYSALSPEVQGHLTTLDLDLGTTSLLKVVTGTKEGHPFNVFDVAHEGLEYLVDEMGLERRRGGLRLQWPNPAGSYALGRRGWVSTDDGYDDAVILHELGHVVHNVHSDSDNPGGLHYFGDSDQDPRLAYGEGWGTAFGGLVMASHGREPLYVDSYAAAQVGSYQLRLRLETAEPYMDSVVGGADEVAVACVLFDLGDRGPGDDDAFGPGATPGGQTVPRALWDVFTGPAKRVRDVTINHVWDGYLQTIGEVQPDLQATFADRVMRFWADAAEPDDSVDQANPLAPVRAGGWSPEHTLYRASDTPAPGTGDEDWFTVPLVAGDRIRVETRYPGGVFDAATQVDTHLTLFDPEGRKVDHDEDLGVGRNALLEEVFVDVTGSWSFRVRSKDRMHRYGRYEVRVLLLD